MDTTGTFDLAKVAASHKVLTCIHKHYGLEDWLKFAKEEEATLPFVAASAGSSEKDLDKLKSILTSIPQVSFICLDVANGYSEYFIETVRKCRSMFPDHVIVAGNVVTCEMTEELILSGADVVKVGIGPGSVCTTRKQVSRERALSSSNAFISNRRLSHLIPPRPV